MAIRKLEDIIAWQKAQELALDVYNSFRSCQDYGFRDQIYRAVVSVSNNIAEGFERGTHADFKRFLIMAKGSASEAKSMLYLAEKLKYIDTTKANTMKLLTDEIRKILSGLINSLKP